MPGGDRRIVHPRVGRQFIGLDEVGDDLIWFQVAGAEPARSAVKDADLAVVVVCDLFCDPAESVDVRAYDEVTGREDSFYDDRAEEDKEKYRTLALAPLRGARTPETVGEYAVRWPRLWARYASRPERLELVRRLEEAGQRYQPTR